MMKKFFLSGLFAIGMLMNVSTFAAPADDDLLLTVVPVIAAATKLAPGPLGEMQKLSGDWYFDKHWELTSIDEFRFYKNTAMKEDAVTYTIDGTQFLSNFSFVYVDAVAGAYDSQQKVYAVVSLWGPPTYDNGSAYVFRSTDKDTPGFDCHYFTDGQGNINNYYIGFGGTLPCDPITKTRRFAKLKQQAGSVSPEAKKAALWARHQKNIIANEKQKGKAAPVASGAPIQAVVKAAFSRLRK